MSVLLIYLLVENTIHTRDKRSVRGRKLVLEKFNRHKITDYDFLKARLKIPHLRVEYFDGVSNGNSHSTVAHVTMWICFRIHVNSGRLFHSRGYLQTLAILKYLKSEKISNLTTA